MATQETTWRRDRTGLGVWPHQGKVAITGWGHSPVDRRWDGVTMDRILGNFAIMAIRRALDDAGVKPEEVDGLLCCPDNMAGFNVAGPSGQWGPYRPYMAPPYDTEDGISIVTNKWLLSQMPELSNVTYTADDVPAIGEGMGYAAQACAEGKYQVGVYVYTANNLEGRYRRGGDNAEDHSRGARQWNTPWGAAGGQDALPLQGYCHKYGVEWDDMMAPVIINEHRNGLMKQESDLEGWSFYYQNGASGLTVEDYINSRPTFWPIKIWDCDRPINAVGAFVFATAERAKDMKQKPIYVMNHNQGNTARTRSSQITCDEQEVANAMAAQMAYEGSGWSPRDVDIFNPYDGYSWFLPFFLEAFGWHGVGYGEARDFFNGDITVEGPHPFCSGGGNLGNGRTRTSMYIDSIQQLRGTAGSRQVNVKAETAICAFAPFTSSAYLCLSNVPS